MSEETSTDSNELHFLWVGLNEDSKRVHKLMDSEVFNPINKRHIYFWSALTEVLIHTRFLLGLFRKWGWDLPEWFNCDQDEIPVEDLLIGFRSAFCHSDSGKVKELAGMHLWVKTALVGKGTSTLAANEPVISEFEDDARISVGERSLYLRRHIFRAFVDLDAICALKNPVARAERAQTE